MFVLDTDIISRTSPLSRDRGLVAAWLLRHKGLSFLSVVSMIELHFGVDRLRLRGASRKASVLDTWLSAIEASYGPRLLPIDHRTARRTGELLARAEMQGVDSGLADACIAATAELADYQVITFNTRHFKAFGVPFQAPEVSPP